MGPAGSGDADGAGARRGPHAVRLRGPWGAVVLALSVAFASAASIAIAAEPVARLAAFGIGLAVAALGVGALPSVPKRLVVIAVLAAGGFVVERRSGDGAVDGLLVLTFVVSAVAAIVLTESARALDGPRLAPARGSGRWIATRLVATLLVVLAGATALAPVVARAMHQDLRRGDSADPFSDPTSGELLSFTDQMDTHVRPRLSNRVVMTVAADRAAYWRATTFDTWDGRRWTRSSSARYPQLATGSDGWDHVYPAPEDPAPDNGVENTQTFTVAAPYSEILYAAATPVKVRTDRFVTQMVADGSLSVTRDEALGRGSTYTVVSREPAATSLTLQEAPSGPLPRNVQRVATDPGVISPRLRALADRVTARARTPYEKVLAITEWLGTHTRYSLDAALPPESDADAVDWFVFRSREGWCEQISSALAVMLRAEGVPARIATGFATGRVDGVTGRYTVRERDAHAWTEVYFPGIGWQGFDPTDAVPLAGATAPTRSAFDLLRDNAVTIVVVVVALGAFALMLPMLVRRLRERRSRPVPTWAAVALADLERIGERHHRERGTGESPAAYAAAVAAAVGRPELASVGAVIDAEAWGAPHERDPEARASAVALLDAARDC